LRTDLPGQENIRTEGRKAEQVVFLYDQKRYFAHMGPSVELCPLDNLARALIQYCFG